MGENKVLNNNRRNLYRNAILYW